MNLEELKYCPGTLAEGFSTYSPGCLRNLFNGKKVNHILPYIQQQQSEEVTELFMETLVSRSFLTESNKRGYLLMYNTKRNHLIAQC